MKHIFILFFLLVSFSSYSQKEKNDSTKIFKKRVLESTEIDLLNSFYTQDGDNGAVTGGIGNEKIQNFTPTIIISIPLNDDDVLSIDAGISAYTSASSSNGNPFSGASVSEIINSDNTLTKNITGSPWVESTGASTADILATAKISYSHSSDDRNKIWSANTSFSTEYDYTSIGFGGSYTRLFNEKNTELGVKASVYLDKWKAIYPTELSTFLDTKGDLNSSYFENVNIYNVYKIATQNTKDTWEASRFNKISTSNRNSYTLSINFSQILSKNAKMSLFVDIVKQKGWLGNPMQRVYFKDKDNFYIGNPNSIDKYTSKENTDVFMLADDIEQLPESRFKIPIGAQLNYFVNENIIIRSYYRFYYDDWGIRSHTANIEVPIKISPKFTLYPSYRYYTQTKSDYFYKFDQATSDKEFYTSDFDLSEFNSNQFGFGINYTDIFTKLRIWKFGMKSIDLKYYNYERNTGFKSSIITGGIKFVMD